MPRITFSDGARKEFASLDKSLKPIFAKHIAKIEANPPRRHLKGGAGYAVEEAGQGRIICHVKDDELVIIHVFPTHKEYEKWYRGGK